MATYRFSVKLISRGDGRSSVAAAAYRAGERLVDERTGEVANFARRGDVLEREILAPPNARAWVFDRERLWNSVERVEKRRDAQVAREIQVSLPHELSVEANRELLRTFVKEQFVDHGMIADVAIHAAHRGGDERNVHAHVLLTTRHLSDDGSFAGKAREWNDRALLGSWRAEWERHMNRALELARISDRVNHQSYAARSIDREPEPKQGPVATQIERSGRRSHAGDDRRAVRERNAERDRLRAEQREFERRLREEQRQREEERRREDDRRRAEHDEADRPGIRHPHIPSWKQLREQALSEAYARDMAGSDLARFWRIERTRDGLVFQNARGRLEDYGSRIAARDGNDVEIRAMLDLAQVKGWTELVFTGADDFKRRAMQQALERGFAVRTEGRDAMLLHELERPFAKTDRLPAELDNSDGLGRFGKPIVQPKLRPGLHYTGTVLAIERDGDAATLYLDWGQSVLAFQTSREQADRVDLGTRARVQVELNRSVAVREIERDRGRESENER